MMNHITIRSRSCATDPRNRQAAADARIPARTGFTLVELLVVILIIAALAAISIVVVKGGVAKADHAKCLANVKQLVAATVLASTDLNGRFPEMEGKSGPWMLAKVNVGYADGHVAAMTYEEYNKVCGWGWSVESYCPIYQKGWKE